MMVAPTYAHVAEQPELPNWDIRSEWRQQSFSYPWPYFAHL